MRSEASSNPPHRVALIGTGLAGLTTAYLLHNDEQKRYRVTLFEQEEDLSFDSASVAVKNEKTGYVERIDLPMRASAGGYYANLMRMYNHLDIPLHAIRFLFVFAESLGTRLSAPGTGEPKTNGAAAGKLNMRLRQEAESDAVCSSPGSYFIHASNLHQTPPWPGNRRVVPHIVETMYLIICHFWFSVACFIVRPATASSKRPCGDGVGKESFSEYLERIWLPRRYVSHYLLPLMSSVSTCSHGELLNFPASDIVNYKKLSHGQQHYAVCGGVKEVQSRLTDGIDDVRLGSRVLEVTPRTSRKGVLVRWQSTKNGCRDVKEEPFDRVVLAVSPDIAGKIFRPLAAPLGKIPTTRVESAVLVPSTTREEARAYSIAAAGCDGASAGCMHHSRNTSPAQVITFKTRFSQHASQTEALHTMPSGVVVSTCPLDERTDSKQTLQSAKFTRTLRTPESRALVESIMGRSGSVDKKIDPQAVEWVNGDDGVWLVGAWCWDGMVLLEGCIVSAMKVADDFGVRVPWQASMESRL